MEKKTETGELDLSISKLMSGCGTGRGTKNRFKNNELNQNDASLASSLGSLLNSSVTLDPTPALMPTRSSISSLLSLSHLRLWENPITASAISAAAAMTHLMDINNSAFPSAFGGKSSEDQRPNSGNMCVICGRVARDQNELSNHMLSHSMEKPYQCVKCDKTFKNLRNQQSHQFLFHNISDGLTSNRMQGLITTSKKKKSKNLSECYDDEPLDVTMPDIKKKRMDSSFNNRLFDCRSPAGEDYTKTTSDRSVDKSMSVMNSINTTAFPCTSCHKTFATEVDLKAHLMRHLTQHPFVCLACGKGFKYEHSLNFHIKSYHNSSGNISNNNNNNTSSLTNNNENETKQSDSHKLSDNQKKCENTDKFESVNTSEADYDEETSIEEETDEDNDEEDDDNDENHNKKVCVDYGAPANFTSRSIQIKSEKILITLLEGIHPVTDQTYILYKCCLCGFAFPSLEPVILHMQTSHLNTNKEFTCDKCGANFKWRSELSLHEQLHKAMDHHDKSGQLSIPSFMQPNLVLMSTDFGPNLSPSLNNNNNNTNNHNNDISGVSLSDEKISQNKYKPHKSNTQTKSRKVKSEPQHSSDIKVKTEDLESHVSLSPKFSAAIGDIEETSPGQFKCRFCDKTFDRIFSVHRHERVHTGFKPCICKTCGRGFSEKRNLRHHIIRFHSDGSGRELLKRNRKDKSSGNASNKRKMATSLKKTALKILNNSNETTEKNSSDDNNSDKKSLESTNSNNNSTKTSSNKTEASIECANSTKVTQNNTSSSSTRRRKGKPMKKIIAIEEMSSVSSSLSTGENNENHDNDETENTDKSREETDGNSGSEINPNDFLETKFRCHGAFFSSYNPRLGVIEKPVKRNEACRPLLGPDGKFLYPCTYCNKTFCSLSDLNRHMNFHEDVRPFKCEFCNYQSRTNSQLKVHMMRHAGIKQYLCQVCNYNGVTQSDLNRHCKTRSHALRSANICPLCALGFSTRTLLDDHIIKFHEASESSNSSDKSNKTTKQVSKATQERNNNDYSFSSKSFSMKEILN